MRFPGSPETLSGNILDGSAYAQSNDPNQNYSSKLLDCVSTSSTAFTCTATIFYKWLLENPGSTISININVIFYDVSTNPNKLLSTSEVIASFPVPSNGQNTTVSTNIFL
jgi:hypothetical protein